MCVSENMRKFFALLLLALALASCSQVNTLYNARKYFKAAQARPLNANGRPNNQAVEEYTKAIKKCGIILSNEKQDRRTDDALFLMARALYYKGNSAFQAKDQFESLIEGFPESPFVGESHIYLAKVMREINQKEQSYKVLQEFVSDSQHKKLHPKALMSLAQFSIDDKDFLQAQFWLQKILTEYPKSEEYREAFFIFGQNYYIEKDYEASLAEFQKIAKDRRIPQQMKLEARYYIAMNQFMLGEFEQCKKTLKKLLKDETRPDKQSLAKVLQARLFLAEGEADKGLAEIENIAKVYPRTQSSSEAQYHLGEYYFYEAQDLEKAGTAYGRVRTEFANSELAEPGQQRSTAVNQLKNSVELDPENNLQAYVDYCLSAAENYFNVFSLPDSALVLYDRLISSRELAFAVRDTVVMELEAQQALVDSLELALQALPEPEPEPETQAAVQDSLDTSDDYDEEPTDLSDDVETDLEPELTEDDIETSELQQDEIDASPVDDDTLETGDPPEAEEESQELDTAEKSDLEDDADPPEAELTENDIEAAEAQQNEVDTDLFDDDTLETEDQTDAEDISDLADNEIPAETEPLKTDEKELDTDTDELLGDEDENDPEPLPVSEEPEESDVDESEQEDELEPETIELEKDDQEQEDEIDSEPNHDESGIDLELEEEIEIPEDQVKPKTEPEKLDLDAELAVPDMPLNDLQDFDLTKPESSEADSLGFEAQDEDFEEETDEKEPAIDEEAEAKRQVEAQRKQLQRELTSAQNDLDRVQKRLDALDAILLSYDRELVPLALFSKANILSKTGADREQMEAIYSDMLVGYPSNKYTNALEDMLAGDPVRLIDPEEEAQELLMEEALGLAESDPDSMISLLEELATSEYPPISLKATFRLAWYYSFELPDTTAAKPYLSQVLELDRNGEYGSLAARFFDGTKFKFPKDEPVDSLAQSDSLAMEAEALENEEPQDLEHPVMDSEEEIDSSEETALEKPDEVEEAPLQEDLGSLETVEPQENTAPVEDTEEDPPPHEEIQKPEPPAEETTIEDSPELDEPQDDTAPESTLETEIEDDEDPPVEDEPYEDGENPIDHEDGQAE